MQTERPQKDRQTDHRQTDHRQTDHRQTVTTSLTLLPAGVEACVAVDKLTDGVETATTVTGVHDGVLANRGVGGGRWDAWRSGKATVD